MPPEFILLKASAGSGKTYALAMRFLSFILSPDPVRNVPGRLPNILAVTFTRNAAREMKERIIGWLKACSLGDRGKIRELARELGVSADSLSGRAEAALEDILADYTEFQVQTIDGFLASVFKASSVDLGIAPDFEIALDRRELMDYAFSRYLRGVGEGSPDGPVFDLILDDLVRGRKQGAGFPWDPSPEILEKLTGFYGRIAARTGELRIDRLDRERAGLQERIVKAREDLEAAIEAGRLDRNPQSIYNRRLRKAIEEGRFADLVEESVKTPPFAKPKRGRPFAPEQALATGAWESLKGAIRELASLFARDHFTPHLLAYRAFADSLERTKRSRGIVFIEDLGRELARTIDAGIVPDVYFRLGDRIFHYLIDEFQDTSPIQWATLRPLIEESLSRGGSLFIVGDTKQAVYGFRDADFRIMKSLEAGEDGFGPAGVQVRELDCNFRSRDALLGYVKSVFLPLGPAGAEPADEDVLERYAGCAAQSGLTDFRQDVVDDLKDSGYVEVSILDQGGGDGAEGAVRNGDEENGADEGEDPVAPEKARVQSLVAELRARGYRYADIAVLTYRNESVVRVASWLNEAEIPFIPYSRLDIRLRKVVREILDLLRFLDSPPDDLAFASFLLGDLFEACLSDGREDTGRVALRRFLFESRRDGDRPLYPAFRRRFPALWDRYFEGLFRTVGYFPLYDLTTQIVRVFDVFRLFPAEEASLTRLLEAVKDFESRGRNDIREFLTLSGREEADDGWTIEVPRGIDAVKIMSIHKAKGLGFPVVIVLLYGEKGRPPDSYLQEDADGIRIFRITKALAGADPGLSALYEERKTRDRIGSLNALYVALTRARDELYVVGVRKKGDTFPFDLLGGDFRSSPEKPPPVVIPAAPDSFRAEIRRMSGLIEFPPGTREAVDEAAVRRGRAAHLVLAGIEDIREGWEKAVAGAIARLAPSADDAPLYEEIGRSILGSLPGSPLESFFASRPGRRILREADFCDSGGRVHRMDRVVVDPGAVTVLDFKTGAAPPSEPAAESDRGQVRAYAEILKDLHPGMPVEGVLAYFERGAWETVG